MASQSSQIFKGLEAINPDQIANLCKWATSFHQKLGEFDSAERLLKKAFTLYTKDFGEHDPKTADICQNLANLYLMQGKYGDAEPWVERLYNSQKEMSNGWFDSFQTVFSLGNIYTKLHKYEKAESLYKNAIELAETYARTSSEFNSTNTLFNGEGAQYYLDSTSGPSDYNHPQEFASHFSTPMMENIYTTNISVLKHKLALVYNQCDNTQKAVQLLNEVVEPYER